MYREYESPLLVPEGLPYSGEAEPNRVSFPYHAYDVKSSLQWTKWVHSGSLSDKTLLVIHSVSDGDKPLRWVTNIIDIAELIEGLQDHGISPPEKVRLMGLIHTNSAANNGNGDHVERALKQADFLKRLAEGYLEAFHKSVWLDFEYDFDTPEIVPELLSYGRDLFPLLPPKTAQTLSGMAEKYNKNPHIPNSEFGAAYLLAHNGAYRRFKKRFGPFEPDTDSVFALPQSERIFIDMLHASDEAVESLGLPIIQSTENVFFLSERIRTSHYYPSKVDPTIEYLLAGNPWPQAQEIANGKSYDKARKDAAAGIRTIEKDLGGQENIPQLIEIIQDSYSQV